MAQWCERAPAANAARGFDAGQVPYVVKFFVGSQFSPRVFLRVLRLSLYLNAVCSC